MAIRDTEQSETPLLVWVRVVCSVCTVCSLHGLQCLRGLHGLQGQLSKSQAKAHGPGPKSI
jgi:hypothetical protein